jgi:hypothetical protein
MTVVKLKIKITKIPGFPSPERKKCKKGVILGTGLPFLVGGALDGEQVFLLGREAEKKGQWDFFQREVESDAVNTAKRMWLGRGINVTELPFLH